mmetsp:Transcript_11216/g.25364  ORF Transcript_11216/g.25364 Transcript_11216/m.25364 type:complete len:316 (-) Transcript_11216:241-1188(-)
MFKKAMAGLTPQQLWHFDTFGYFIVRGALSSTEVAQFNAAIDANLGDFCERKDALRNSKRPAFAGDGSTGRLDCGKMLNWASPHADPFRRLLAHPKLVPILASLVGDGFRLDHAPLCFMQKKGAEGFDLHGGACKADGSWYEELAYDFRNGRPYCRLLAMSLALTPTTDPKDGGFIVMPGSHKSNLPLPEDIAACTGEAAALLHRPVIEAGDVLFFTEAATHGTAAWTRDEDRRVVLYRYAPGTMAYGRAYQDWSTKDLDGFTDAEKAVLLPPWHNRLDRPVVSSDGETLSTSVKYKRAEDKKQFDKDTYGTEFF